MKDKVYFEVAVGTPGQIDGYASRKKPADCGIGSGCGMIVDKTTTLAVDRSTSTDWVIVAYGSAPDIDALSYRLIGFCSGV